MNHETKILLLAVAAGLASALASRVQAQTAVPAWVQRYSAPANTLYTGQKLVVDSTGNVIVVGNGDTGSGNDWSVIKYTSVGAVSWTNRYFGPMNGTAFASAVTADGSGNVFATGHAQGTNSLYATVSYATIKYSSAGVPLWTNLYNGPLNGSAFANALAVDGSGNAIVTGYSVGPDGTYDYATIKYSSAGVPLWTNGYAASGSDFDEAVGVAVDSSGNVFVTGYSDFDDGFTANIATVAYSGAGAPLWTNLYQHSSASYETAAALAVDGSGNVFVTASSGDDVARYITLKYSGSGVSLWTNHFDGLINGFKTSVALALDSGGNAIVTGYAIGPDGSYDYATLKYSSAGAALWTNYYTGAGSRDDFAAGLAVDGSDNAFVTGYSVNNNDGNSDFVTVGYSGSGMALWTNVYHGPVAYYDTANAVAADTNGNVFVTGSDAGSFATLNYSGAGAAIWTNRFNDELGNAADEAAAVIVDGGGVFVTGYSLGVGSGYDFATIKYSSAGVLLWTNRYNGPGNNTDVPLVMAADSGGNVIVAGYSWNGTNFDYATIKYSSAGAALWTNRYNGPGDSVDYANALAVDTNDNVFVTGASTGVGVGYDHSTIKYSSAGVPLWTNRYNGPANSDDYANALAVDASGNVFVTGSSTVNTNGSEDYATIKYSSAGVALWTNLYNGPGNGDDQVVAAAVDGSGNLFVTGMSIGSGTDYDYATLKYSSAGALLWTRRYSGPYFIDIATALAVDAAGNVAVTGSSLSPNNGSDYATIKYSGAGAALWTNRYDGGVNSDDYSQSIAADDSGNVFVTGSSYGADGGLDYATIAYSSAGGPWWTNRYNGPGNGKDFTGLNIRYSIIDALKTRQALAVGHDGSVYVTGTSDAGNRNTAFDFATVKYVVPPELARPGVTSGHFTFITSGSSGASVEIQASTNLQSWSPLVTNTLVGGTNYFSDPQSADAKARFYRALLLP